MNEVKNISYIRRDDKYYAEAFDDIKIRIDNLAKQLATSATGAPNVPPQIGALTVTVTGVFVDATITDNSKISRAISYHIEYDTDPSFTNPRGIDLGSWRNLPAPMQFPNGTYYFRAYSQYAAGGPPSAPVPFAGNPVTVAGSVAVTLLPSQASGTGEPFTGGGDGAGRVLEREL